MFICPTCHTRLVRTENEYGVFWRCATCGGCAIGLAVLRRTVVKDYINKLWLSAHDAKGSSGKDCPACAHRMAEVAVSQSAIPLMLDVCTTCQFVWFDPREYEQAPPLPPASPEEAMTPEERQHLAIAQVKGMGPIPDTGPNAWWQMLPALFGMPVEEDVDELTRAPWLTWGLTAAILLVAAWTFPNLPGYVEKFGLIPDQPWRLAGLTFFTSFFLHGGTIHLFSNLYFLFIFGDNVEDFLGRGRYILLIALAALAGDLLQVALALHSNLPCIGASAGVAAIVVCYALQFPHAQLGFFTRFLFRFSWTRMPAWTALCFWLAAQILAAWQQAWGFSNISPLALLAGAAVGVLFWLIARNDS